MYKSKLNDRLLELQLSQSNECHLLDTRRTKSPFVTQHRNAQHITGRVTRRAKTTNSAHTLK